MKKFLFAILALLLVPTTTLAMERSTPFKIGDKIEVKIISDDNKAVFYVIKPSAAGEQFVWALLNGNVEDTEPHKESIIVYDQTVPGEHEATHVLEESYAYGLLVRGTAGWRIDGAPRLLNEQDLTDLGIPKQADGKFNIMGDRKFIGPVKLSLSQDVTEWNYWTQIEDTTKPNKSMYAVTFNPNNNNDTLAPVAFVESFDISMISGGPKAVIRPVVKIDKQYIDCIVGGEGDAAVESVPTSEIKMPIEAIAVVAIASLAYILIRKKEIFKKI